MPANDPTKLTRRDREVIAAAYEVDAARARAIPVRNPFVWFFLRAVAKFLEERAKSIREGNV
jgi:hypothetical protein